MPNHPKALHGATVGVLLLETRFPRIIGDIGNALSWDFPVQYRMVKGATPSRIVHSDPEEMLPDFISAGQELVAMGCDGIATTCGFLSLLQKPLKQALAVPVVTSALMQIPIVQQMLPCDKQVGVITIDAESLSGAHLHAVGAAADTPVVGIDPQSVFGRNILQNQAQLDPVQAQQDLLQAAKTLTQTRDNIGAIVLECTNMAPYAAEITQLTALPVYSIYTLIQWFHAGLQPRRFALSDGHIVR